jgi:hypothetical protein
VARAMRYRQELVEAIARDVETRTEVSSGTHKLLQDAEKRANYERNRLDGDLRDLASVLGLDPQQATVRELSTELRRVLNRIPLDHEVRQLRGRLQAVINAASAGLEPIPGEAA